MLLLAGVAVGAVAVWALARGPAGPVLPPTPLVVERMREVARLETLDLQVYKKSPMPPSRFPAARCGATC